QQLHHRAGQIRLAPHLPFPGRSAHPRGRPPDETRRIIHHNPPLSRNMRYKVLTVDDSKTVRIIVKKAFKSYDCEIIEAANGVEGLAAAAKEQPDVILLDITMPVMDGVEMLTKLKADPATKAIPVVMLTAEGGRDN